MNIRFMNGEQERLMVTDLAQTHPSQKEFPFVWTRWNNWDTQPPIVVLEDERVVAFHAAAFNKRNPYVNSYYQLVHESMRGQGVAGKMVDFLLLEANNRGRTRLKMRANVHGLGAVFWMGFGLKPLFTYDDEHYFDLLIDNILNCGELIEEASKGFIFDMDMIPASQMKRYLKKNPGLTAQFK